MAESAVTIEFKGRHDHITERMQAHAAKKLARLARMGDRLVRIEVVADHAHKNPEIELIAHLRRGTVLVAKDRGASFAATIDLVAEKMESQLRKLKERRKDHKVPDGKTVRGGGRTRGGKGKEGDEETYDDVVRRTLRS
jgi:ribosomal subunit interface protein